MTTNQTIDGVPLLPCPFCGVVPKPFSYPRYAPVEVTCDDEGCPAFSIVVSRDDWNKRAAAQPQGDTVPVSAHWSDWSMVTLEIEGQHRTYVEYGEPKAKPVAWKTGSITWAYEPDARRHGERHGVLVKPLFDRPLYAEPPAPVAVVLSADELRFLEAIALNPGAKLNGGIAWSEEGDSMWGRLEELGLIECVGGYKWKLAFNAVELGVKAFLGNAAPAQTPRPDHANPPPGTEPSGTHHDNDGLDEWRKPVCCGSCPGGCVIQSANK